MKNILVTGGAGYIGSQIVHLLIKKKYNVFIIDDLSEGFKSLVNKKCKFYKINITNEKKVSEVIKKNKIDSVIHLAAKTKVSEAEKNPKKYFLNNITGTFTIVKVCIQNNVKNLIFSSTCAVYDEKVLKVKETSLKNPKGIYGFTKLIGEEAVKKFFLKSFRNYAILRYFNVVGASPYDNLGQIQKGGDKLFKNFSVRLTKKKPVINIYGNNYNTYDGTCVRDYIHVFDIAEIHIKTLLKINSSKVPLTLNCGYGKGISVLQVAKAFKKFTSKNVKINFKKRRTGDMEEIVANNTKLKKILRWKPRYFNLNEIVKTCMLWEKKMRNN
tara:strand:+ start:2196 stop:3176 length:981 start_codon:yes stop_codon:yes gene_type:complete